MAESVITTTVSPLDYFAGDIQKPRLGFRYRLGLAVVCVGMIVLPAIYLALVLVIAAGVVWYAVAGFTQLAAPALAFAKVALYCGPILVGLVVVLFLLKPVFARTVSDTQSLSLGHEEQPELFQFLGKLCQLVNAPPPSRVDVNCDVNVSASFRGGLRSLWGNDLVLTIGLPLVAGMTARQFAGVIAHELGHFAQDGAMRSGYLIETVNRWFYQVVYERDEWDVWLSETSERGGGLLMVVALFARLGVWVSRKVLFVLMFVGVALSRYLSRQMEFDADSYAAKVAGSAVVGEMLHQLSLLYVARRAANENLGQLWSQRKLVDDLSALVLSERERFPAEFEARAREWSLKRESLWYSTHPSHAQRIAAALRLAEPGVFILDQPASCLFRSFSALSKEATRHHYEKLHGLLLRDNNYKPTDEAVAERTAGVANREVLAEFAPGAGSIWWPVTIDPGYLGAPADASQTRCALESVVQQIGESKNVVTESVKGLIEAENRLIQLLSAKCLVEAGVAFTAADFGLSDTDLGEIDRAILMKREELIALESELARYSERYGTRFMAAAQLLYDPGLAAQIPEVVGKRTEALRLVSVLSKLQRVSDSLREVARRVVQLQAVYDRGNNSTDGDRVNRATQPALRELGRRTSAIRTELLGVIYPFEHANGKIALNDFCRPEEIGGNDDHQNVLVAVAWLQRLPSIYTQALSRLAGLLADVERAVGIESVVEADSLSTEG